MALLLPTGGGLVDVFRSAAGAAFNAFSDLQQTVEILRFTGDQSQEYDPETGGLVGRRVTPESVPAILTNFTLDEIDERVILRTDRKVLIELAKVSGAEITSNDKLRIQGMQLDIINVRVDPAGAVYNLQVRVTGGNSPESDPTDPLST